MVNISLKSHEVSTIFDEIYNARKKTISPLLADTILLKLYNAQIDRNSRAIMRNQLIEIHVIKKRKK